MADHNQTALEIVKKFFQHAQGLNIEIVGRLIQDQHIRLVDQRTQEIKAAAFTTAQAADAAILHVARKEKPLQHLGSFDLVAIFGADQRRFVLDKFDQAHTLVKIGGVLVVIGQLHRVAPTNCAFVWCLFVGQQVEQRAFARAIGP